MKNKILKFGKIGFYFLYTSVMILLFVESCNMALAIIKIIFKDKIKHDSTIYSLSEIDVANIFNVLSFILIALLILSLLYYIFMLTLTKLIPKTNWVFGILNVIILRVVAVGFIPAVLIFSFNFTIFSLLTTVISFIALFVSVLNLEWSAPDKHKRKTRIRQLKQPYNRFLSRRRN